MWEFIKGGVIVNSLIKLQRLFEYLFGQKLVYSNDKRRLHESDHPCNGRFAGFNHIVRECVKKGIVTGENVVSDGSFIPANIASDSIIELHKEVEQK